ncbi:MAG TPA: DUF1843 domain-containing protein [Acetobacteraceae bacterium]|jgi:hypothetical protein|nr:DUF1843 domain-containing protein [Acetobacteraceae bacterium]
MAIIYNLSTSAIGGVQVQYTEGGSFVYTEGTLTKTFTSAEVTTDSTGLGTLVSVPLLLTIDTGGSRFGVFLPTVELSPGQTASVTTVGVTETFSGPDSFPRRPTTWRCMALQGTVTDTQPHIVPLYAATIHNAIATGDLAQLQALSAQADGLVAQQGDLGGAVAALKAEIAKLQSKSG